MRCIVTAGPTYEPLDAVRRITNFSTGRLGSELANYLVDGGHEVCLLIGDQSTWNGDRKAQRVLTFGSTASLRETLESLAGSSVEGVFHAAAVSDFGFGKIWQRDTGGNPIEIRGGKITSRGGSLLAELFPIPKLIMQLRGWFPRAVLVGWKYEVEGGRDAVMGLAEAQISECQTDACVANGPAYGEGFGLITATGRCLHFEDRLQLFGGLEEILRRGDKRTESRSAQE